MKPTLAAVCGATLLIISAHRMPAPILEEKPAPTEAPSNVKSAPIKHKSSNSSDSSSIRRFDGTWRYTGTSKSRFGNTFSVTKTLIIQNGTAVYTLEKTATLASGKKWTDLPAPYNSISPIYQKWTDKTTDIKAEGSNLKTRWPGNKLTDLAPKTIPVGVIKNAVGQPNSVICILSGEQLIATSGKGGVTYTRVH
jgi:hypothetical protein